MVMFLSKAQKIISYFLAFVLMFSFTSSLQISSVSGSQSVVVSPSLVIIEEDNNKLEEDDVDLEGDDADLEGDDVNPEGDDVNLEGDDVNLEGDDVNLEGDDVNLEGDDANLEGDDADLEGDDVNPEGDDVNPEGEDIYPIENDYKDMSKNEMSYNVEAKVGFSSTPTYIFDFSTITEEAASNRQVVTAGSNIINMPGAIQTTALTARNSNFNIVPAGGTIRASGTGQNTFIDPNGRNRRLESIEELTGPIRVVITGRSTVANSMATATINYGGHSITQNVTSSNTQWSTATFDFPDGNGILSLNWEWTESNRLGIQKIEIFEGHIPATFPSAATYQLDFSRIEGEAASARQTVSPASSITTLPGTIRSVDPLARHSNFNLAPAGGTIRASGSGQNTFIDPNGQNRRLESTVALTGPIRVVITGRSTLANNNASATINYGERSITQVVSNSNSQWSTATYDFPSGNGILSIDWPWTSNNRLGIQQIEIFEGTTLGSFPSNPTYLFNFSRISEEAASLRQVVAPANAITTLPGTTRNIASTARQSSFNMAPAGGTIRASGSGNNTFIDPNGQNRRLESTVKLTGPIQVVITGRSTLANNMATATVNYGGQSITQNVSNNNSQWSTVTFDFPNGWGVLSIDWPWTSTNRLAIQRIEIFEGSFENQSTDNFPVVEYRNINNQPQSWYGSLHSRVIADNLLVMQRDNGGWPRGTGQGGTNFPTNLATMTNAERQHHINNKHLIDSYFGRGITTNETRYLFTMYEATRDIRYKEAAMRGFNAIITSQYTNGGWPYYVTDRSLYRSTISFKDNAIPYIMDLLRDIYNGSFPSISNEDRQRSKMAFDKGLDAILNLQIWYDENSNYLGRNSGANAYMGAWAANSHDITMEPRWARQFEPPSIGVWETVRVLDFLMTIENPNNHVIRAINGGVNFINKAEIYGYDHITVSGNRVLQNSLGSRGLWARFLCVETLVPLFYDRQSPNSHPSNPPANQWLGVLSSQDTGGIRQDPTGGIRRNLNTNGGIYIFNSNQTLDLTASYANLSHERRNGYQYIGNYGRNLQTNYDNWKNGNGIR